MDSNDVEMRDERVLWRTNGRHVGRNSFEVTSSTTSKIFTKPFEAERGVLGVIVRMLAGFRVTIASGLLKVTVSILMTYFCIYSLFLYK
jgi:hypothetical protein